MSIRPELRRGAATAMVCVFSIIAIPVAILGSDAFDVADVDMTTLAFGPDGAAPAHRDGGHTEDANDDGFTDFLSHYWTQEMGIVPEDPVACVMVSCSMARTSRAAVSIIWRRTTDFSTKEGDAP